MRPVLKGNGPGYVPPATLSWNRYNNSHQQTAAYTALISVFNDTTYPNPLVLDLAQCLEMVLKINLQLVTGPSTAAAKSAIMDKASEVYKLASIPLVDALGGFCAFCETSIPGLVEVEHVANKAIYPTYMTTWENFVPTCGPCNTAKANKPDRATVVAWDGALNPNLPDDTPFYDVIRHHYAWPDLWNGTYQYFPLDFQMSEDDGATWTSLSLADAVDLQDNYQTGSNLQQRKVWADLRHGGVLYWDVLVRVRVLPVDDDLVALCGLNKADTAGTYDRRVYNRTVAWFSILSILRPLMEIDNEKQFLQFWPVVQHMSVATGFWSLWVTLLSQFNDFVPWPGTHSLGWWLYNDLNAETFYPGTNPANIQLPPRQ
jgi:hypothetical protein